MVALRPYLPSVLVLVVSFGAAALWEHLFRKKRGRLDRNYGPDIVFALGFCIFLVLLYWPFKGLWGEGPAGVVVGVASGICIAIGTLLFPKRGVSRDILYMPKSDSRWMGNVGRSLQSKLEQEDLRLTTVCDNRFSVDDTEDAANAQIEYLESGKWQKFDVVVIAPNCRPGGVPQRLMESIRNIQASGREVILIDTKVENYNFYRRGIRPPYFVANDFEKGGELIAEEMRSASSGKRTTYIIVTGPSFSHTGVTRARSCLWYLNRSKNLENGFMSIYINSWDEHEVWNRLRPRLQSAISKLKSGKTDLIQVFCGFDGVAKLVASQALLQPYSGDQIQLFGFDGAKEPDGSFVADDGKYCVATIELHPDRVGERAASLIVESVKWGRRNPIKNLLIRPDAANFR